MEVPWYRSLVRSCTDGMGRPCENNLPTPVFKIPTVVERKGVCLSEKVSQSLPFRGSTSGGTPRLRLRGSWTTKPVHWPSPPFLHYDGRTDTSTLNRQPKSETGGGSSIHETSGYSSGKSFTCCRKHSSRLPGYRVNKGLNETVSGNTNKSLMVYNRRTRLYKIRLISTL